MTMFQANSCIAPRLVIARKSNTPSRITNYACKRQLELFTEDENVHYCVQESLDNPHLISVRFGYHNDMID